ncbi:5'3'-exonuclease N- and I-domain-containing protein [Tieghemostelium lacteum]|uniref:5'3'-exonuclease N-and I-domain-containing protein n=1 Tax=Tieghemostelium lacteum TaxID=361077 RepID=A0A151Z656_TIELA|nr:5'3'-exonuclease N- and I-domain-containing protein [Tieghemostelium lacteum]|eukprot:KYQ89439.1 5'3'-exonuclease N- and I-domain-containing protein [Tieghemostelium lacteum]
MSSIKLLKEYLEKISKTTKIEALNDHRIGIEAIPWIFKLPIKEPFHITMGGLPLTLIDILEKEIEKLKKSNIKPFFVFNGLSNIKERTPPKQPSFKLNSAWDLYYRGQYPQAEKAFQDAIEKSQVAPYIPHIIAYFKQHGIEFFKAPYFVGPQLAYFSDPQQKSYLNAVYGSPELLLFGVQRLIIDIDFEKGTYVWVDLKTILQELAMTHDQFIDACLICGYEYCANSPFPFAKDNFRVVCEMVKASHSGFDVIRNYAHVLGPSLDKYLDQFLRTKTLIQNHLILYSSGVCEPIYKDVTYQNKLTEINTIFGSRLPNDVYFYISQGVISQQVINNFVSGSLVEPSPAIDFEELRTMLEYLKRIRTKTIGLLAFSLNNDLKSKSVKFTRWFEPKESDIYQNFDEIAVLPKYMSENLQRQIKSKSADEPVNLHYVCKSIQNISNVHVRGVANDTFKDMDEAIYMTIQQALSVMNYIVHPTSHSGITSASTVYAQHLSFVKNEKLQEPLVLLIELLRAGVLSQDRLSFIPTPKSHYEFQATKPSSLLVSRVLSLVPVQCDATYWDGPIDHDLMSFQILTKSLFKTIRNLLEMTSLHNFLTYKIMLQPSEYTNFSMKLPFFCQPNVGMGLLAKGILLDNLTMERLEKVFPNFTNLKSDLELANEFWEIAMKLVQDLNAIGDVSSTLLKSFKDADQLWKTSLKASNLI